MVEVVLAMTNDLNAKVQPLLDGLVLEGKWRPHWDSNEQESYKTNCLLVMSLYVAYTFGYSTVKKSHHYFITRSSFLVQPIIDLFIRSTLSDLVMISMSCT